MLRWLKQVVASWFCPQWRFEQAVKRLLLSGGEWYGCELRDALKAYGLRFSDVGFNSRMARMEDAGRVICDRRPESILRYRFRKNVYRLPVIGD